MLGGAHPVNGATRREPSAARPMPVPQQASVRAVPGGAPMTAPAPTGRLDALQRRWRLTSDEMALCFGVDRRTLSC